MQISTSDQDIRGQTNRRGSRMKMPTQYHRPNADSIERGWAFFWRKHPRFCVDMSLSPRAAAQGRHRGPGTRLGIVLTLPQSSLQGCEHYPAFKAKGEKQEARVSGYDGGSALLRAGLLPLPPAPHLIPLAAADRYCSYPPSAHLPASPACTSAAAV